MELLSTDDVVSKDMETDESTNDQQLTETELCNTYGYELAMSPAETNMPDDGDQSWISVDSTESQTTGLKVAAEDFDLLEPFLFGSERTYKRPGRVSELYWFSEDSSDSQTSVVKACSEEFDQLETILFSSKEPSMPLVDLTEDLDSQPDEGKSDHSTNIQADQQVSSEKYIAETTILVKAIVKKMTLGQKMKFYGWFNSGLSIEEAALKSKNPDLIPPPVRHPDCKLSKKRLERLSKILPNVFLQRQFVNGAYFVGVDPKQIMRYLLMDLGSENLMATFECQFALEEYAAAKDKQLRQDKRERAAAAAVPLDAALAPVQQLSNPDLETGAKELNSEIEPRRTNGPKLKNLPTGEKLLRGNLRDRTADALPISQLTYGTMEKFLREDTRNGTTAAADALSTVKQPPNSDLEAGTGEPNSKTNPRNPNDFRLKGNELKKSYFWHKQGLPAHAAASRAKMNGLDRDIAPHPDWKHSWKKLQLVAKACSEGKDPGEVLKDILPCKNDSPESSQVAESGSGSGTLRDNFTDSTSFVGNVLVVKPYAPSEGVIGTKAIETSADTELPTEIYVADPQMPQRSAFKVKRNSDGENKHEAEVVGNKEHSSNIFRSVVRKHKVDPVPKLQSVGSHSETPWMSLKQLKKYYKWRNQDVSHSEALVKAQTPGLTPESVPHPVCKYSLKEVKVMSDAILKKHKRLMFQIEVFYGGKKPEDVMKTILSSYQEDTPSKPNPAADPFGNEMSDRSIGRSEFSHAKDNCQMEQGPSRLKQAKSDHAHSVNDRQLDEDTTGLSNLKSKQLIKYKWRNWGFRGHEAMRIPGLSPGLPHPDCHHSVEEIEAMESALPTRSLRSRFQFEVCHGGKDPNELLKHTKTEVLEASEPKRPNFPNAARRKLPRFLRNGLGVGDRGAFEVSEGMGNVAILNSAKNGSEIPALVQNRMDIEQPSSGEMSSARPAFKNTISEELDDSMFSDSVLELSNYPLKKYYAWRNTGLSHDAAFFKALGEHHDLSGREANGLYVAHRSCKYSRDKLKQMSLKLPEGWARERFLIHVLFGGMDPAHAMILLKRTPLPNNGLPVSKSQTKLTMRVQMKYLMGKGLNRKDAMKIMRNPSENQMKELEEVIQLYCIRKADKPCMNLAEGAVLKQIPLSSPYHPSKLLSDDQLKKYYLWISQGFSRGDAVGKVMNGKPISQDMRESHYLRSKYNLEEVKKMSKTLMNKALAKTFITEVFYGQTDPDEIMEFMSNLAKSVKPHQDVCLDEAKNPWLSSKMVQDVVLNPLHSAEAGLSTMTYSGYPQPAGVCSPKEQQYMNNTMDLSDSPNQTPSSPKRPLYVQNPALENNQVQCYIVPVDFPNEILTEPQMDAIENGVLEAILEMDDDDAQPSFRDSFRTNGCYGIICKDEFSVDWLYKYLRVYEPWDGALLRLITIQSTKMRANAMLPLCKGDDDEKILKFIGKQNFGLNVDKWTVSQRCDSSDGTYMDLVIDEESAEILMKSSRISFKLGSAEIITAHKDSSNQVTDSPKDPPASPPPLPSSPPPAPPPPPPPSPQPPLKPCTIDTSLGALLKSSASKSYQDRSHKVHSNSARGLLNDGTPRASSPEEIRGKIRSRRDQSLKERKRSRSSFLDPYGRVPRNSSPMTRKRRLSEKERKRSASKSTSRDHGNKRRECRKKYRYGSKSPSPERSGFKGRKKHSLLDWFHPGGKKRSPERFMRNPERAPPLSTTPCSFNSSEDNLSFPDEPRASRHPKRSPPGSTSPYSFISSEDNLSSPDNPCRSSLPTCPPRANSLENTEYAQYLGNSIPKPSSDVFVDLTDST